jgi:hypothetical protein
MGYFLAMLFKNHMKRYGFELVLALLSVNLIWAGLNVGFNIGKYTK